MMKLKRYSRNSVNPAPPLLSLLLIFVLGCSTQIEPTYKEKDIPAAITKICKDEYGLNVTTAVVGKTLWVYAPVSRIIDKDYAITKEKIFDDDMSEKLRNIMTSIGRVLISSDQAPDFYRLVVSDTKERGIDYLITADTMDIKKAYANFLPFTEMNRRYLIKLQDAPGAMGDVSGGHIHPYDISREEFVADLISQRIETRFREDDLKNLYEVKSVKARFADGDLFIDADIKPNEIRLLIPANSYIIDESLKIIAQVSRDYNFWKFQNVEIDDMEARKDKRYSRAWVEAIK
jgi:hypothetical protein